MKAIRYTLLIFLACLTLGSCQDVEEPMNTVPAVTTDAVEKYSGEYAYLSGNVTSRSECYFLISTTKEMGEEARKVETYARYNEERGKWFCQSEIGNLEPGTTYYVVLCATDGRSEVRGNVVEFTTPQSIRIANISMKPCGNNESEESTKFTPEDTIGMFLTMQDGNELSVQNPWNMEVRYQSAEWVLPAQIIPNNTPRKLYAYYPYYKGMERDYTIPVVLNGIHYLYGNSEELTQNNAEAHITMQHALVRVTFSITKAKGSEVNEYVTRALVYNNHSQAISLGGRMNALTGEIIPDGFYNDGISKSCEFKPEIDKVNVVEMLVIPTQFEKGQVTFEIQMGEQTIYASLPAAQWEQGKHYDYPFEITLNGLRLGNVTVEEWENNEGGSININK